MNDYNEITVKLWRDFSAKLLKFIKKRVSNKEDAEDILHDVFIKIHTSFHSIKTHEQVTAWIYRITRNTIIDYYRKNKRITVDIEAVENSLTTELNINETAELLSCLQPFINKLPEAYRLAFISVDMKGMPQNDFAAQSGLSISGAKSRVQRARTQLRNDLYDCCNFEFDENGGIAEYSPRSSDQKNACRGCK